MSVEIDAYGGVAAYYDACVEPLLASTRRRVTRLCHEQGARRVLDICCGTGKQLEKFQELNINLPDSNVTAMHVYGVDMSRGMLQVAQRTARKQATGGRDPFMVVRSDATCLPFAKATFDMSIVSLALHEMPMAHAERLVHEALRVSKSLLIMDYCMPERNIEVPATWLAFLVERLVGGEHYQNYRIFMRQGAVEGLITRLGLQRVVRHKVWAGAGVLELVRPGL